MSSSSSSSSFSFSASSSSSPSRSPTPRTLEFEERYPAQWPPFWRTTMVDAAVTYVTTLLATVWNLGGLAELFVEEVSGEELREEANHEAELKLGYMRLRWEKEQEKRGKGGMLWLADDEYLSGEHLFLDPVAMKLYMQSERDYLNDAFLAQALNSFCIT
ncbi:uncharacterized protein RAG0_11914 [Rhynchosporium agropyri]|uniref:Uncharacterized protein n=1 Tax=Rhynchosporium agropyri TaxID=914238 RepID=A0A1E1L8Y2_9HELO|nr:uncharacterized protein RAG0_11914 [Rhynchosporium agropyri]